MTDSPRTALVTGAARRIGREIALSLAADGWRVGVHFATSTTEATALVKAIRERGGQAEALPADLAQRGEPSRLLGACRDALGPVSCLVNNASTFVEDTIATTVEPTWDEQMAVNLRAPVMLAQAMAQALPDGILGNVVNIIDQRVLKPSPEYFSYAVSKEALFSATRMMAQALAPRIRVNGIGPGPVLRNVYQSEAEFEEEARSTLLGHAAKPGEIAAALRFILDAPSLTGQMIAIDAGQHLVWSGKS